MPVYNISGIRVFGHRLWPVIGTRRLFGLLGTTLILIGCASEEKPTPSMPVPTEAPIRLSDLDTASGQKIYVPAYSRIYYTGGDRTIDLAVTLSIHNTDAAGPIVLTSVRYYDTQGRLLKDYLAQPRRLAPLEAVDFFVDAGEQSAGVGSNFIVEWIAEQPVYEPIVEALMLSTRFSQGISFISPGRVVGHIVPHGR